MPSVAGSTRTVVLEFHNGRVLVEDEVLLGGGRGPGKWQSVGFRVTRADMQGDEVSFPSDIHGRTAAQEFLYRKPFR